ncbi:hypothetical protein ABEG75_11585 [Pantoea agglomerans]|uniref:hypothetical protein n=1 Tax=Enterobacter agglomerans TaxID=549 RepID=UPI0005345A2D|nr:hypothetical protein [Pantoea agglomerans]QAV44753.1 hypothetical protein D1629_08980 [Pantoea agglomerans]QAV49593.1 hypothetical protein D1628_09990 [Pantoea agglomerans]
MAFNRVKVWLLFVIVISYFYVVGFSLIGLLSSTDLMYANDKAFWSFLLLLINIAYCTVAFIHLFRFDRRKLLTSEATLSKYASLMLTICPLLAALFDPFKLILLKWNITNEKTYFATGVISLFIIFGLALTSSLFLISKSTDRKKA